MKKLFVFIILSTSMVATAELTSIQILNLCRVDAVQEACDYKDIQNELTEAELKCTWVGRRTNSDDCKEVAKLKLKRDEALKKLKEVVEE